MSGIFSKRIQIKWSSTISRHDSILAQYMVEMAFRYKIWLSYVIL